MLVYYPGLHGPFVFDDSPNIVQNDRLHVDTISLEGLRQAAFSSDAGTLKRPLSMLTFWMNYYISGLNPFGYKLTNLIIHLLNGLGIFWLTTLVLRSRELDSADLSPQLRNSLATATAVLWLVHPLNLTAVLYVVQRMTSLAGTFVLLGVICYIIGRNRLARGQRGFSLICGGLVGFGGLAVLSKENGALLPLYMAVVDFTLFGSSALQPATRRKLNAFFAVTVVAPALFAIAFIATHPHWLAAQYATRDFTLAERLMTEARVLCLYLRWIFVPTPSALGLFHDDIAVSTGLLHPFSTLVAAAAVISAGFAAICLRKRYPLFAFATLWYLAGHFMESSFIGLGLVFEHRNYLPMYGPLLAGVYLLYRALGATGKGFGFAVPAVFVLVFAGVTAERAHDWKNITSLSAALVQHHPDSALSNYQAGTTLGSVALRHPDLAPALYPKIKAYLDRSTELAPRSVNGLFDRVLLDATNGRAMDDHVVEELSSRLSTSPLRITIVGAFEALVDWSTKGTIALPKNDVLKLFEAALGNRTINRITKASLLALLSSYYGNVAHDLGEAVSLAIAATETAPSEPVHHLSLARLALQLGNLPLAATELHAVTQNDSLGRFKLQTQHLTKELERAKANVGA